MCEHPTKVTETRSIAPQETHRRHHCHKCGHKFTTIEVIAEKVSGKLKAPPPPKTHQWRKPVKAAPSPYPTPAPTPLPERKVRAEDLLEAKRLRDSLEDY
jgi:hypothetical protein